MSAAQQEELLFLSNIDQKDFLRFALFDTFRVKKRWKTPVLFALLMTAFAAACFALRQSREQALLLSGVLLGIGLILPLVWYLWYLSSVKKDARELGLSKAGSRTVSCFATTVSRSGGKKKKRNMPGRTPSWPAV